MACNHCMQSQEALYPAVYPTYCQDKIHEAILCLEAVKPVVQRLSQRLSQRLNEHLG